VSSSCAGRVAARLGDNIDTDVIYPGRFLNITDREKTAEHLFELAYPEIRSRIRPGDFLVAGKNFGCGSSREQATAAIKYAEWVPSSRRALPGFSSATQSTWACRPWSHRRRRLRSRKATRWRWT
jgi:aconitase A